MQKDKFVLNRLPLLLENNSNNSLIIRNSNKMARQGSLRKTNHSNLAKPAAAKLPDYLVDDLRVAAELYQTQENPGMIHMTHVRGILWNFGYWRMTNKQFNAMLRSYDIDPNESYLNWNELLEIVTKKYNADGRDQEILDTFRLFDKKDKGTTTISEIRAVFKSKLDFPITDEDVNEMFQMAGIDISREISLNDFMNVMKSF